MMQLEDTVSFFHTCGELQTMSREAELMSILIHTHTHIFLTKYYTFSLQLVSQTIIFFLYKIIYVSQIMLVQIEGPLLQKNCILFCIFSYEIEWNQPVISCVNKRDTRIQRHKCDLPNSLILTVLSNPFSLPEIQRKFLLALCADEGGCFQNFSILYTRKIYFCLFSAGLICIKIESCLYIAT